MRPGGSLLLPTLVAAAVLLGAAGVAHAQTDTDLTTSAAARALFDEGIGLVDAGQWAEAADRFGRALELRWSPVIALNYATALEHVGRLVEASELLRRIERAGDVVAADVRASAAELFELVTARIARVTVRIAGDATGVEARLDGRPLPAAMLGIEAPIDPGSHEVSLHRGDEEIARTAVTLADGERSVVELAAPPPATNELPVLVDEPEPGAAPEAPGAGRDDGVAIGLVVGGVGLVVIGGVIALAVVLTQGPTPDSGPPRYCGSLGCGDWM